jgi:hypothetical protein
LKTGFIKQNGKKNFGTLLLQKPRALQSHAKPLSLVLKRDVVSTYWAWGSDGFLRNLSEMMRTIDCNRVTSNLWEYRWKWFFGEECQTAELGGTPAKDHE